MRQQLSLFPEEPERPKLKLLESSVSEDAECVRLDPELEKTLDAELRYHDEYLGLAHAAPSRIGDWAEQKVHCIAMSLGLEVFPNISCVGLADLVIKSGRDLYMLDVKIANRDTNERGKWIWHQTRAKEIKWDEGVYGVVLVPSWNGIYCRWYNKQKGSRITPIHPPGLRNLWQPSLRSMYRTVA